MVFSCMFLQMCFLCSFIRTFIAFVGSLSTIGEKDYLNRQLCWMICDTIWICVSLTCFPNHLLLASIRHIKQHFLTCFHVHFKLVFLHIWMATFIPLISCIRIFISVPPVCQLTNIVKQTSFIYLPWDLFVPLQNHCTSARRAISSSSAQ